MSFYLVDKVAGLLSIDLDLELPSLHHRVDHLLDCRFPVLLVQVEVQVIGRVGSVLLTQIGKDCRTGLRFFGCHCL